MPIVTAESHNLVVGSTHRLCAERLLLEKALARRGSRYDTKRHVVRVADANVSDPGGAWPTRRLPGSFPQPGENTRV